MRTYIRRLRPNFADTVRVIFFLFVFPSFFFSVINPEPRRVPEALVQGATGKELRGRERELAPEVLDGVFLTGSLSYPT